MEDRQRQIREGAGLEESRLNTEFIDFLRKYSTPMLLVVAAVAGGYGGLKYLERQRELARDSAFVQLESALNSRSATALTGVADDNESRGAVAPLARLNAAVAKLEEKKNGTVTVEQLADLEAEIGALQGKLGGLEGQVGARQGELGHQQGRLGAQQGRLGAEQGRLGAEQGRIAREADAKVKSIIDESLKNGKARPVQ